MKNKNDMVEICRFLACYVIFSYHAKGTFCSGWIFVEYFFMLSGYFTVSHLVKMKGQIHDTPGYPIRYSLKKFKRLFPYTTVGFAVSCFVTAWNCGLKGMELVRWILYLPINVLFLPGGGIMPSGVEISGNLSTTYIMSPVLWYICAMFVALPVMVYLLLYAGRKVGPWLVSFLPMLLYGYLIISDGTINGWHEQHMAFFALDIRALAGLLLGGLIYYISVKIGSCNYTRIGKVILTVAEVMSLLFVLRMACITDLSYDALVILLFVVSLSLTLSGKTLTSKIHLKFVGYLGKISLPVYCLHSPILEYVKHMNYTIDDSAEILVIFLIVAALSVVLYLVIEKGKRWFDLLLGKLKRLIII